MARIRVGDTVIWKGSWGSDPAKEAKVLKIERCRKGEKYGKQVDSIGEYELDRAVFDLDNGHWAYGYQIQMKK